MIHCYADVRHDLIHRLLREELDKLASIFETLWKEAENLDP